MKPRGFPAASHSMLLAASLLIAWLWASRVWGLTAQPASATVSALPPTPTAAAEAPNGSGWPPAIAPDYLTKDPLLHTEIPRRARKAIVAYRVRGGDSVIAIAYQYGISPESILWANEGLDLTPDFLRVGQGLVIPPVTGVLHEVKPGDTLDALAKKYKADVAAIVALEANALAPPYALSPGQRIMVPNGEKPYVPKVIYGYSGPIPASLSRGSGNFVWPIRGVLTQNFWTGHRAIDIGARTGSTVMASDSGFVVLTANDDAGYGKHVMINHGNGFESLYAHVSAILVQPGQAVKKGQVIALSGNSGRSTGPHLHFEIRYLGAQRNPTAILP